MSATGILRGAILCLTVCLITPPSAQGASDRDPTPQELAELEAELAKARREKPDKYRSFVVTVQIALGAFGFGTGPFDGVLDAKTRAAIRQYQRLRKLAETGDVDAKTFLSVDRDYMTFLTQNPYLPSLFVGTDLWDQGYVLAKGTWTIVNERLGGIPLQTSEIQCRKAWGFCIEATASIIRPSLGPGVLGVNTTVLPIERWDKHEITTNPVQSGRCVRYSMRIGRQEKTVTGLRLRTVDEGACKELATELHLKLLDGHEVWRKLYEDRGARIKGLLQAPGLPQKE